MLSVIISEKAHHMSTIISGAHNDLPILMNDERLLPFSG